MHVSQPLDAPAVVIGRLFTALLGLFKNLFWTGMVYDRTIRTIRAKLILFASAYVGPVYDRTIRRFLIRAVTDRSYTLPL